MIRKMVLKAELNSNYLFIMDKTQKEHILSTYYFNAKNPGGYLGASKLHKILDKKYPRIFSVQFINKWLNNQDSYALQKQVRHRYRSPRVQVAGLNDQADIDLMSVENISKYNDGVKYLLIVIDIFSRFLFVRPLINKKTETVLTAIKDIFKHRHFKKVRSDKGSEFINKQFRKYMKDQDVYFFTTQNVPKANYAERVQRTFRNMMFRMMRKQHNYTYINHLQDLVANYNKNPHRSLSGLNPSEITKQNEADVWANLYLKPKKIKKSTPQFKFKIGDLVRISYLKHPFRRTYQQQYTSEVFKIKSRLFKQGIPLYKIVDLNNEPILGYVNEHEMIRVDKNEDSLWFIDKILKKRKLKGKIQYYVQWEGFPKSFNSWVDADEIKEK